jgi:hypothetical protein
VLHALRTEVDYQPSVANLRPRAENAVKLARIVIDDLLPRLRLA